MPEEIVPTGEVRLWLPGLGAADRKIRAVARAVEEYDHSLRLARHELYGDWVVVIGDQGHPVYGFGKDLPQPESVERILSQHDIKRHGKKMMDQLSQLAEKRRLEDRYRLSENDGQVAEAFEHAFRREGRHPVARAFIPKGV